MVLDIFLFLKNVFICSFMLLGSSVVLMGCGDNFSI